MAKCYIAGSSCPFRGKEGAEKVEESHIEVRGRIFFLKPRGGGQSWRYSQAIVFWKRHISVKNLK